MIKKLLLFFLIAINSGCATTITKRDCSLVKCKQEEHDVRYWRK